MYYFCNGHFIGTLDRLLGRRSLLAKRLPLVVFKSFVMLYLYPWFLRTIKSFCLSVNSKKVTFQKYLKKIIRNFQLDFLSYFILLYWHVFCKYREDCFLSFELLVRLPVVTRALIRVPTDHQTTVFLRPLIFTLRVYA